MAEYWAWRLLPRTNGLTGLTSCLFPSHLPAAQDVAVSSGSACTSASLEPSYVLRALGVEEDMVRQGVAGGGGA